MAQGPTQARTTEYSVRSESAELEKYDNNVIANRMTQMTWYINRISGTVKCILWLWGFEMGFGPLSIWNKSQRRTWYKCEIWMIFRLNLVEKWAISVCVPWSSKNCSKRSIYHALTIRTNVTQYNVLMGLWLVDEINNKQLDQTVFKWNSTPRNFFLLFTSLTIFFLQTVNT